MGARSKTCRQCSPIYERTTAHRKAMSVAQKGIPKPALRGKKRPEHSRLMKAWWTSERKEKHRQALLKKNPSARYHGLSSRAAARLVRSVGACQECGHDGSKSRLDVHHRNGDKRDQRRENLEVLCHQCHMREHSDCGEIGWTAYWKKRKTNRSSATAYRPPAAPGGPRGTPPPCAPRAPLASPRARAGSPHGERRTWHTRRGTVSRLSSNDSLTSTREMYRLSHESALVCESYGERRYGHTPRPRLPTSPCRSPGAPSTAGW